MNLLKAPLKLTKSQSQTLAFSTIFLSPLKTQSSALSKPQDKIG